MRTVNMENRSSRRHEINVTANLLCNDLTHPAIVLDISTGGAKIQLINPGLQSGIPVQIDLPFLNELQADVVWANGRNCGIRFYDTQDHLSEFLYNLAIYGVSHQS